MGAKRFRNESYLFVFMYSIPQTFTFAPAAWRNCFLPHWSPQHPFVNSKNCSPGVPGLRFSYPTNRPQATSSGTAPWYSAISFYLLLLPRRRQRQICRCSILFRGTRATTRLPKSLIPTTSTLDINPNRDDGTSEATNKQKGVQAHFISDKTREP